MVLYGFDPKPSKTCGFCLCITEFQLCFNPRLLANSSETAPSPKKKTPNPPLKTKTTEFNIALAAAWRIVSEHLEQCDRVYQPSTDPHCGPKRSCPLTLAAHAQHGDRI